jgi:hypothetical protein
MIKRCLKSLTMDIVLEQLIKLQLMTLRAEVMLFARLTFETVTEKHLASYFLWILLDLKELKTHRVTIGKEESRVLK